ncbi:MAG: hypothetical protein JJT96_09645 [Opitutales bacterium]|nr:hypothetical protein [Opitutales bacterium]
MVLQHERPIRLFGGGSPGAPVRVSLAAGEWRATVDAAGAWNLDLPPVEVGGPYELKISSGSEEIVVRDVWFGEVWLIAGQSNVIWPYGYVSSGEQARHRDFFLGTPARIWQMPERSAAEAHVPVARAPWLCPGNGPPASLPLLPSALATLLERGLGKPVGILVSALGGSRISSWLPTDVFPRDSLLSAYLNTYPADPEDYAAALQEWREARDRFERYNGKCLEDSEPAIPITKYLFWGPRGTRNLSYPGGAFEAMIRPLARMALRGVVWYQGESDAEIASGYGNRLRLMIEQWRSLWLKQCEQLRLPFVVAQLPAYAAGPDSGNWPFLREEQERAVSGTEDAYCVPTTDLGDPQDIHPANKIVFALRLAPTLQALTRGEAPLHAPAISRVILHAEARRPYLEIITGAPLQHTAGNIQGFDILDAGGDPLPVSAKFCDPRKLILELPVAPRVYRGLRYNFQPVPKGRLYGLNGFPLRPFRNDHAAPPYRANALY